MHCVRRLLACLLLGVALSAQMSGIEDPQFVDPPIEDPAIPLDPMLTDPDVQAVDGGASQQLAPANLEDIIGVTWDELRACTADADCVLIKDFTDCCQERPVNMRFASRIEEKRITLMQKFMSSAKLRICHMKKCVVPHRATACRKDLCEVTLPPPRLEKVQALNIAVMVLSQKVRSRDFGAPIFGYDAHKMLWMVDFGPIRGQHKQKIKDDGVDTGYRVLVDDQTEKTEILTYHIKQDILP